MLKTLGIFKLTIRENLRGQILWSSAISGLVLILVMTFLSSAALSHESRIIDVFSYFVSDQMLLLVGIFSGAAICSTDFSARGVAELYIPAGVSRRRLLLTRALGHAINLLFLALALYAIKLILPYLGRHPALPVLKIQVIMFFFGFLKGVTALCIAMFIGSIARPLYSILGTLTLFSFGHLTSTFDSLMGSTNFSQSESQLGFFSSLIYNVFKIWNPNLLVLESARGSWLIPSFESIIISTLWAFGFILISIGFTLVRLNRTDIRG